MYVSSFVGQNKVDHVKIYLFSAILKKKKNISFHIEHRLSIRFYDLGRNPDLT